MATPRSPLAARRTWWIRIPAVAAVVLLAAGGAVWTVRSRSAESAASTPAVPPPAAVGVGALGRLEPGWRVLRVGPAGSADGARIESLLVDEGSEVGAGAVLAVLDTRCRREAALQEARAQVLVARARLGLVKAGTKPEDVAAQEAAVDQMKAAVERAEADFTRLEATRASGAASAAEYGQRQFQLLSDRAKQRQAVSVLASLKVVRLEDVSVAEAELARAEAGVSRAEAELEAANVRSPMAGRILKVNTRAGEKVGESGVAEIGNTAEMHAVAEVYERDVPGVRVGQRAVVRVQSLPDELTGEVVHVGWRVGRRVVLDNDPVKDTDARVVEVRVKLDPASGARVVRLSYARVEVRIGTTGGH